MTNSAFSQLTVVVLKMDKKVNNQWKIEDSINPFKGFNVFSDKPQHKLIMGA